MDNMKKQPRHVLNEGVSIKLLLSQINVADFTRLKILQLTLKQQRSLDSPERTHSLSPLIRWPFANQSMTLSFTRSSSLTEWTQFRILRVYFQPFSSFSVGSSTETVNASARCSPSAAAAMITPPTSWNVIQSVRWPMWLWTNTLKKNVDVWTT